MSNGSIRMPSSEESLRFAAGIASGIFGGASCFLIVPFPLYLRWFVHRHPGEPLPLTIPSFPEILAIQLGVGLAFGVLAGFVRATYRKSLWWAILDGLIITVLVGVFVPVGVVRD